MAMTPEMIEHKIREEEQKAAAEKREPDIMRAFSEDDLEDILDGKYPKINLGVFREEIETIAQRRSPVQDGLGNVPAPVPAVDDKIIDDVSPAQHETALKEIIAELEQAEPKFKALKERTERMMDGKTAAERQAILTELRETNAEVKKWEAVIVEKIKASEALKEQAALARFQQDPAFRRQQAENAERDAKIKRADAEIERLKRETALEAQGQKPATPAGALVEETKVSEEERCAQQQAILDQYKLSAEESARREAARVARVAAAKKAEEDFQELLRKTALEAQEQEAATPAGASVEETKVSEEERRTQETLLARFQKPSDAEVAKRIAAREEERLARDLERAIAASLKEAEDKKPAAQLQEQEPPVRVVFSDAAAGKKPEAVAPATPAIERKDESEEAREVARAAAIDRLASKVAAKKPGTSSNSVQSAVGTQASTSTTTTTAMAAIPKTPKK